MPTKSTIQVVAKVAMVGVTGLNPESGYPGASGLASKIIGTDTRWDSDVYLPAHLVSDHNGRLRDEIEALWNSGSIDIVIDGRAITAITELNSVSQPTGLERRGEVLIPATSSGYFVSAGTWTEGYTNNLPTTVRTAEDTTVVLTVPIPALYLTGSNGAGRKPRGVRVYYQIATAVLDALSVGVYSLAGPTNGVAMADGVDVAGSASYDSDHDTAGERVTVGHHTLELTLSSDDVDYLESGEGLMVDITVDGSATGDFTYKGLSFLYFERPGPGMEDS